MNKKIVSIFATMICALTLSACGEGYSSASSEEKKSEVDAYDKIDFETAHSQVEQMFTDVSLADPITQYVINTDMVKEYKDSVKHRYEKIELRVNLDKYRVMMLDDIDDHNGQNYFASQGTFWFFLSPEDNWGYTTAFRNMYKGEVEKEIYNTLYQGKARGMEGIQTKSELPPYTQPKKYSLTMLNEIMDFLEEEERHKPFDVEITSDGHGYLKLFIKSKKFDSYETIEFKNNYLVYQDSHSVSGDLRLDTKATYKLEPVEFELPKKEDFHHLDNN